MRAKSATNHTRFGTWMTNHEPAVMRRAGSQRSTSPTESQGGNGGKPLDLSAQGCGAERPLGARSPYPRVGAAVYPISERS